MRCYVAKWRRPYKEYRLRLLKPQKEDFSTRMLAKAAMLYRRGVQNDDRETLLAADSLLDEYERLSELTAYRREQSAVKSAIKTMKRALSGDVDAIITILKATGDLPKDYKLSE